MNIMMRISSVLLLLLLIVGGCQVNNEEANQSPADMNSEDLPDVRAFQDEFTKNFLQSTKEKRPGYYPFLSGTGAYKMDFPADGVIGEEGYALKKNNYEDLSIGIGSEDSDIKSSIQINYYSNINKENIDRHMKGVESRAGLSLDFEKVATEFYAHKSKNIQQTISTDDPL